MTAARRTLLSRVIDYAGLYPPARLPLDAAVAEFTALRAEPAAWMLARFVCPAARAAELADIWGDGDGALLVVAAIGAGGADAAEVLDRTRGDVAAALQARDRGAGRVAIDQLEVRLPADVVAAAAPEAVREVVGRLTGVLAPLMRPALLLAVEAPVAGAEPASVTAVIEGIARHNRAAAGRDVLPVAFKLRCGGLVAGAVPASNEVAAVLAACRYHGVAIKATQGLHHPVRRHDATLGTATHGFVNLLAAAALGRVHDLDEDVLAAILGDEDAGHFDLGDDSLRWRDLSATVPEIAACRRHAVMSFGSCSFAEPREDLVALGWLEV